jgi:hypothetical protein
MMPACANRNTEDLVGGIETDARLSSAIGVMRSLVFPVCAVAALAAELYVLVWYAPWRIESRGRHTAPVEEFGRGARVSQTFTCLVDGLDRIDVMFQASGATDAAVHWELRALQPTGERTSAASGLQRLRLPQGESWQRIAVFAARPLTAARYTLILTLDAASVCTGAEVAVLDALNNPRSDGYLAVDGVPRWGDLAFQAHAQGDTVAGRFTLTVLPALPRPFNHALTWIGLLAALNVLAAVTVREMLLSP